MKNKLIFTGIVLLLIVAGIFYYFNSDKKISNNESITEEIFESVEDTNQNNDSDTKENNMEETYYEETVERFATHSGIILPISENDLYPYGSSNPVGPDYDLYMIPDDDYRPNTIQYQISTGIAGLDKDECSINNSTISGYIESKEIVQIDGQNFIKSISSDNAMNQQWKNTRYNQKLLSNQCRFIKIYRYSSNPGAHSVDIDELESNNDFFENFVQGEIDRILENIKVEKPIYKAVSVKKIKQASEEIIKALDSKDFQKLESLTSSNGIFFGTGPYFDPGGGFYDHNIEKENISEIPNNQEVKHRYTTDGKGEKIYGTLYEYIYKWVYSKDYKKDEIKVNSVDFVSSNSVISFLDDIGVRNYTTIWHKNPSNDMGDTQIVLIFDEEDGEYKIRGILSHFWTI